MASGAKLFIDRGHPIIERWVTRFLEDGGSSKAEDLSFADFDDVRYLISVSDEAKTVATLTMSAVFVAEIKESGAMKRAEDALGPLWAPSSDPETVSLRVDASALPSGWTADKVVTAFAELKDAVLSAPFARAFSALTDGGLGAIAPVRLTLKESEAVYIAPKEDPAKGDRVALIYALRFGDVTDQAVARVVCGEMTEATRQVPASPSVTYHAREKAVEDPPKELAAVLSGGLRGVPEMASDAGHIGYLVLTIMSNHVDTPAKLSQVSSQSALFRPFLVYHIKAAKAQMHSSMRARVASLLKVLKRAQPSDDEFSKKEKKLASGKTFVRK